MEYKSSWPFLKPVKQEEVPDYYDVIKKPMDFQRMREKIMKGEYKDREAYIADVMLICSNAKLYNTKATIYYKCASELEKYSREILINLKNESRNEGDYEVDYLVGGVNSNGEVESFGGEKVESSVISGGRSFSGRRGAKTKTKRVKTK